MKRAKLFASLLISVLLLTGCVNSTSPESGNSSPDTASTNLLAGIPKAVDFFSAGDLDATYEANTAAYIELNGDSASCASDAVRIEGSTITILDEGTYILSGTLNDGTIMVDANKDSRTQLVLDNVNITGKTTAPICILQADKVTITLATNSENTLTNGGSFTAIDNNNVDAVIYSTDNLTLNGSGKLTISSPAGHGIVSKDQLLITGGNYNITAGFSGLVGKDALCIAQANFYISAGNDGLHAENKDDASLGSIYVDSGTFVIESVDDAIHTNANAAIHGGTFEITAGDDAIHADNSLIISGGDITVENCYEGLEGLCIDIYGGNISLYASDDGLNAAGGNDQSGMKGPHGMDTFAANPDSCVNIFGGSLYLNAQGDGIDSNGSLTMSGGSVVISGPNRGDTAVLDYGTEASITGGTFIGTGASQMNTNFSNTSAQGSVLSNTGTQTAGTAITLTDADGKVLISHETDQDYSSVIISCPLLTLDNTYTLTVGTTPTEFTLSQLILNLNGSGGWGGQIPGGGFPGGGKHGGGDMPNGEMPQKPEGDFPGGKF